MANPPQRHVDSATMFHGSTSASRHSNVTRGNENIPCHASTSLGADALSQFSRSRDAPSVGGNDLRMPNKANISHRSRPTPSQDVPMSDDNEGDSAVPVKAFVSRRPRSRKDPISSQIGFYTGHWVNILTWAKQTFRHEIHTNVPFPERSDQNLRFARECILESITRYLDDNKGIQLDTR